jgi:membrane protein
MSFLRQLVRAVRHDHVGDLAAMMTYYTIFSVFPMAIFVVTVALLAIPPSTITEAVVIATQTMPAAVATLALEQSARMQAAAHGGIAAGSAVVAIWGASRGSVALARALNAVYGVEERRPWWKVQLIGVAVTLAVALLLVVALALLLVGPLVGSWIGSGELYRAGWTAGRWLGAALLVMTIWALLYRFLPDTGARWRVFTPGALTAVVLWIGGSLLFAWLVQRFGRFERTYGTLGAVLMTLAWLWFSNIAMLVGAEINKLLEDKTDGYPRLGRPITR